MSHTTAPHGLTEDNVLAMNDAELVAQVYKWVGHVPNDHLLTHDALYRLIGEAFERFIPELEWANVEQGHADDPDGEREIEASWRAFRRRQGARMLKQALEGGNDA